MEQFWSQPWPLIVLSLIFSILLTWLIGLLPVLLIRYLILHRPLSKFWSVFLASVFWLFNVVLFELLGSHSSTHPSLFLIGLASYYIYRTNKGFRVLTKDIWSFIVYCCSFNYLSVFLWLRYLGKRKVVLLSVAAVALSSALLIAVASLFNGFIDSFEQAAVDAMGDVVLLPTEKITDCQELIGQLEQLKAVEAATATLSAQGLLHLGKGNVRAVDILGIEVQKRGRVTAFGQSLLKGKPEAQQKKLAADDQAVNGYIGIGVLCEPNEETDEYDIDAARAEIGREVVLTMGSVAEDKDGRREFKRKTIRLVISDVVFNGVYYLDSRFIRVPIEQLQEVIYPDSTRPVANQIQIKLRSGIGAASALAQIRGVWKAFASGRLGWDEYQIEATQIETARQLWSRYIAEVRKQMGVLLLIFGVVSMSAVLLVFCIFYMIVDGRRRDVAILKSCGAASSSVAMTFIGFGGFIGIIGTAFGTAIGYSITKNINMVDEWIRIIFGLKLWKASVYMFSRIPNEVDWQAVVWIALSAIAGAAIGAVIPAISAAMTRPVNVLRYE
jgi:lipoprotein-releasing system permease protein